MEHTLKTDGRYTCDQGLHTFEFHAATLSKISSNLRYAAEAHIAFQVVLPDGVIQFVPGASRIFDAVCLSDGFIQITADPDYLLSLANTFSNMANETDPELIDLVHTHLDTYLSHPSINVTDIVIERIDNEA